jgi:hypothetical protein
MKTESDLALMLSGFSDPVEPWNFDVALGSKVLAEVSRVKATATTLAITFIVTKDLDLRDFTNLGATVHLYQKVGDDPKYISLRYNLTKLKATTFDLDGTSAGLGINTLMHVTQVYTYDGLSVHNSK